MRNPRSQSFSSFSSVLVWTSENDTKTLECQIKILNFIFAAMKTDTFGNAFVWKGPQSHIQKSTGMFLRRSLHFQKK